MSADIIIYSYKDPGKYRIASSSKTTTACATPSSISLRYLLLPALLFHHIQQIGKSTTNILACFLYGKKVLKNPTTFTLFKYKDYTSCYLFGYSLLLVSRNI